MDVDPASAESADAVHADVSLVEDFLLDQILVSPRLGTVLRGGSIQHLSPRAMLALRCLAASAGTVVSRQQLESFVWPHGPAPHSGVAHCISELRHALGDEARANGMIESLTGRGYRLVPVPCPAPGPAGDDSPEVAETRAPTNRRGAFAEEMRAFWTELRERRVFRVSVAYLITGVAVLQAAALIFPIVGLPDWLLTGLLLAGLIGYPVAVLLSWTIQRGPQGLHFELSPGGAKTRRHRRAYLVLCTVIGAAVVVLSVRLFERIAHQSEPAPRTAEIEPAGVAVPANSIAVLRFANIGARPEDSYFSDGLSEELLNLLTRYQDLRVASRTSSWTLPADADIGAIRKRLRVDYIVEGSVRRDGNALRVTAQLIKTADGFHLWSETYDRQISEVLAVQDEIAAKVAAALKVLLSSESSKFPASGRWDVAAYEAYLRGTQRLRMPVEAANLGVAERYFLQAKEIEPTFGGAWAGLCHTWLYGYGLSKSAADFERAEGACHRTLTLDETSPGIFEALGSLYALSGQHDKAEKSFDSALVLAPHSADALIGLGETAARAGDVARAEALFQQAIELDPGYWRTHNALGSLYFNQGRAAEAIAPFRRVTQLAPDYAIGLNNLGAAYFINGDYAKATEIFARSLAIEPDRNAYSNSGTALFMLRDFAGAAERYRRALELAPEDYLLWGNLGDALLLAGSADAESRDAYATAARLAGGLREINPGDPYLNVALARYYARLGRSTDAERMLATLDGSQLDMYVNYDLALTRIALEQPDSALGALASAIAAGYRADLALKDPGFDALRDDPEFVKLTSPGDGDRSKQQGDGQ